LHQETAFASFVAATDFGTTKATGVSPDCSDGLPTTATSPTSRGTQPSAGWRASFDRQVYGIEIGVT